MVNNDSNIKVINTMGFVKVSLLVFYRPHVKRNTDTYSNLWALKESSFLVVKKKNSCC